MEKKLFGGKVRYEQFTSPFILVGLLNCFNNRYQAAGDAYFKELSWKQVYFLHGVTLFDEAPTIRDIADFMGCSHQNSNKLCTKLLELGYLSSVTDKQDRRKQRLSLTERGKEFLTESDFGHGSNVYEIFSVLTEEEIRATIDVIAKLTKRLKEIEE